MEKQEEMQETSELMQSNNWTANDVFEAVGETFLENGPRIDLHGCSVQQAKERVIDIINQAITQNSADVIHVITGRGKHINSNGTSGVLFKKMQKWVKEPKVAPFVKEVKKGLGTYLIVLNNPNKTSNNHPSYQLTEKALLQLAKEGNRDAQFQLGKRLLKKGDKSCQTWLLKAANQGDISAMLLIGYCHAQGRTAQHNPKEAIRWWKKAAPQNPEACINLGTMFWSGEAGMIDLEKAIYWYKEAEKLGSIIAQRHLGIIFFRLKQYEKAAFWNQKAASNQDSHAKINLATQLQSGLGIQQNERRAAALLEEATKEGILEAKLRFGYALLYGTGIDKDYKLATKLFLEVGLYNNSAVGANCQFGLYLIYRDGLGCTPNLIVAENWLKRAAQNKHPTALSIIENRGVSDLTNIMLEYSKEEIENLCRLVASLNAHQEKPKIKEISPLELSTPIDSSKKEKGVEEIETLSPLASRLASCQETFEIKKASQPITIDSNNQENVVNSSRIRDTNESKDSYCPYFLRYLLLGAATTAAFTAAAYIRNNYFSK